MITGTSRWYTVGSAIVTAVRNALTTPVARSGMTPGDVAWDDCNCDGLLAVTVPRVYLAERFPDEAEAPAGVRCQAPYEVAEIDVSVLRCDPQPQGQDLSPKVNLIDEAAAVRMKDTAETTDALSLLLCGMQDRDEISDFMIGAAESAGPEGACVGFTLKVRVGLDRA